jgi:hypothetical protein
MAYQIFTRQSHIGGSPTPASKPRRAAVVDTIQEARSYCQAKNAKRSKVQVRDGFHYEFADQQWFEEAFG